MKHPNSLFAKMPALALIALCFLFAETFAQKLQNPDVDYYQSAYKLSGLALKQKLHDIIKGHTIVSYASLYTHYRTTDTKPNSIVWDMYSDKPGGTSAYFYTHGVANCGNYSKEGDCYNREHSWPQSWFSELSPPVSDIFHIYPTDGYVNGRRSNDPYSEVPTASWTSTNGSKSGASSFPGYSGSAFEPIDAYKGDLARSQLYMSVRYFTEDAGWSTSAGTNKSELLPWYANLLYKWHIQDTISTKEIDRNNAIFNIQMNRNPFIDHPEFAAEIWQTNLAPSVEAVKSQSLTNTMIDFSRYLDSAIAVNSTNFVFDQSIGSPSQVVWGVNNDISKVLLTTSTLIAGTIYSVQIKNLKSINSVAMRDTTITFRTQGPVLVENEDVVSGPVLELNQNYPNPVISENSDKVSTTIKFNLGLAGNVSLKIYDILGREVVTLVNNQLAKGYHSYVWNVENMPSGLYIYRIIWSGISGGNKAPITESKKIVLVR